MVWRRLNPGELDHEFLWLGVSLLCALVGWFWLHFAMPLPGCVWHEVTGLPCPTCGATRCVLFVTHGAWKSALLINPFVFVGLAFAALYDLYAVVVLSLRLPRLRFDRIPRWIGSSVRYGVLLALVMNWAWLVYRHV